MDIERLGHHRLHSTSFGDSRKTLRMPRQNNAGEGKKVSNTMEDLDTVSLSVNVKNARAEEQSTVNDLLHKVRFGLSGEQNKKSSEAKQGNTPSNADLLRDILNSVGDMIKNEASPAPKKELKDHKDVSQFLKQVRSDLSGEAAGETYSVETSSITTTEDARALLNFLEKRS